MKLALLLGLSLPALRAETLTYGNGIDGFAFSWTNLDRGSGAETGPSDPALMTNGVMTSGSGEMLTNPQPGVWGTSDDGVQGMVGTFAATSLDPGAGNAFWDISRAAVVFVSDCFGSAATEVTFYYDDFSTGTRIVAIGASTVDDGGVYTFEADIPVESDCLPYMRIFALCLLQNGQDLSTTGAVTFEIASNQYCEGDIEVVEFVLEGIRVATLEPSTDPSSSPTTSAEPTLAPVRECRGEITWGDPHFHLMAWTTERNLAPEMFNFQGLGWYYYIFPCDMSHYENWPFFLEANHERCWHRGDPKGCINSNRLVLNTKPEPWVIDFTESYVDVKSPICFCNSQFRKFAISHNVQCTDYGGQRRGVHERVRLRRERLQEQPHRH